LSGVTLDRLNYAFDERVVDSGRVTECENQPAYLLLRSLFDDLKAKLVDESEERAGAEFKDGSEEINAQMIMKELEPCDFGKLFCYGQLACCGWAINEDQFHARFDQTGKRYGTIRLAQAQTTNMSDDRAIHITDVVRAAIERHALESRPHECCGLLSGKNGLITDLHPLRNDADRPETRYFASPEDLFSAMRRIREAGQTLLGIYHSHPRAQPYPSAADVEMAFYPEAIYFIISLEPKIDLRAFRIGGARIESVDVAVVQDLKSETGFNG